MLVSVHNPFRLSFHSAVVTCILIDWRYVQVPLHFFRAEVTQLSYRHNNRGLQLYEPPRSICLLLLSFLQTVKYLYLSFVDSGALLDYYVLSTEGHIMPSYRNPVDAHVEEEDYLEVGDALLACAAGACLICAGCILGPAP